MLTGDREGAEAHTETGRGRETEMHRVASSGNPSRIHAAGYLYINLIEISAVQPLQDYIFHYYLSN